MNQTIIIAVNLIDDLTEDFKELQQELPVTDWIELNIHLSSLYQLLATEIIDESHLTEAAEKIIIGIKTIPNLADWFADTLAEVPEIGEERRLSTKPKSDVQATMQRLKNKMLKAADLAYQQAQEKPAHETDSGGNNEI